MVAVGNPPRGPSAPNTPKPTKALVPPLCNSSDARGSILELVPTHYGCGCVGCCRQARCHQRSKVNFSSQNWGQQVFLDFQTRCQLAWIRKAKYLWLGAQEMRGKPPHCRGMGQGTLSEGDVLLFFHSCSNYVPKTYYMQE